MRQALHIFQKDVRFLWREITLMLLLSATLAWAEANSPLAWLAEILWMGCASVLIARVVHAEAIPGQNQFWITRPYRWGSLLGAKVLFIAALVNLPLFAAEAYVVLASKYPLGSSLPGLIWSQFLMVLCVSLPMATLAAITAGIAPFLTSAFLLLTIAFGGFSGMFFTPKSTGTGPVEWVRSAAGILIFALFATYVVYGQYRKRSTGVHRMAALSGLVLGLLAYFGTPWGAALSLQERLSPQPFDRSRLRVVIDPAKRNLLAGLPAVAPVGPAEVALPFVVTGVPDDAELDVDAVSVTIEGAGGGKWKSDWGGASVQPLGDGATIVNQHMFVDRAYFARQNGAPVVLHASIYFTLFGNPRQRVITVGPKPVNAGDGLRCGLDFVGELACKSLFRWPRGRVYAQFGHAAPEFFTRRVSYSPFPASAGFNPFEQHLVNVPKKSFEATLITKDPISHFRRDCEIRNVVLSDFIRGAHPPIPARR